MLVDGANHVRGGAPHALAWDAVGAALAIVLLSRRRRGSGALVIAFALTAALPGLASVARRAPDEPERAAALASSIETFARAHGCAIVSRSSCEACDPVVRFALAPAARCATPAPIVLEADALEGKCVERAGTLVCGGRR